MKITKFKKNRKDIIMRKKASDIVIKQWIKDLKEEDEEENFLGKWIEAVCGKKSKGAKNNDIKRILGK